MSDMTSAVAIDLLDNLIGMVDDNQGNDYDSALHMAIDALKAQADGDTISRQAAIDAADRADYTGLAIEDVKKVTDEVVKELKRLPPAQPQHDISKADFLCPICGAEMEVAISEWVDKEDGEV